MQHWTEYSRLFTALLVIVERWKSSRMGCASSSPSWAGFDGGFSDLNQAFNVT